DRGLAERHPRREGRRDACDRDPEPPLPAGRRRARRGRHGAGLASGADRRSGRAPLARPSGYPLPTVRFTRAPARSFRPGLTACLSTPPFVAPLEDLLL